MLVLGTGTVALSDMQSPRIQIVSPQCILLRWGGDCLLSSGRSKAFLPTKLKIVGTFQHCCDATAKFFLDCDQAQDQMTVAGEIVKMPGMDEYARTLQ
jgi:hypothetical protein